MDKKVIGKCPLCGGDVIENPKGYGCSNWKEKNCKFVIWKNFYDKQITPDQAKDLIEKGKTSIIKGWVSRKKGTEYDSALKLKQTDTEIKVAFDFD